MKRRGFLRLLGGATTAPFLPSASLGGVAGASYPAAAFQAAVAQAKGRLSFSVFSLAQQLGLRFDQTEDLMRDLSKEGILGPLQGTTQVGRWARSHVWQRPMGPSIAAQQMSKNSAPSKTNDSAAHKDPADARSAPSSRSSTNIKEPTMDKFTTFSGIAAPMPLVNIDTDMIIPKQFLKTIKRSGLGVNLFDEMRFDRQGNEIPDFVLNQPQYRETQILVAGDNFGCGSSREHAPWAIKDFGIRCVISTSFADIFYNNCFKNGILPIVLPQDQVDVLMADAEKGSNARIEVNLEDQTVTTSDGVSFAFDVDAFKKHCLINGLDDIGLTMEKSQSIAAFEAKASVERPWV